MPNPTPKLTAEERAVADTLDYDIPGFSPRHRDTIKMLAAINIKEKTDTRRKAFEEAAEYVERENLNSVWGKSLADGIRALAKEQEGLVISKHLLEPKK